MTDDPLPGGGAQRDRRPPASSDDEYLNAPTIRANVRPRPAAPGERQAFAAFPSPAPVEPPAPAGPARADGPERLFDPPGAPPHPPAEPPAFRAADPPTFPAAAGRPPVRPAGPQYGPPAGQQQYGPPAGQQQYGPPAAAPDHPGAQPAPYPGMQGAFPGAPWNPGAAWNLAGPGSPGAPGAPGAYPGGPPGAAAPAPPPGYPGVPNQPPGYPPPQGWQQQYPGAPPAPGRGRAVGVAVGLVLLLGLLCGGGYYFFLRPTSDGTTSATDPSSPGVTAGPSAATSPSDPTAASDPSTSGPSLDPSAGGDPLTDDPSSSGPPSATSATPPSASVPASVRRVTIKALKPGDCVQKISGSSIRTVPVVNCDAPHQLQLSGFYTPKKGAYPGQKPLMSKGATGCAPVIRAAVRSSSVADLANMPLVPSQATWTSGERKILCFVGSRDSKSLTGSVLDTDLN